MSSHDFTPPGPPIEPIPAYPQAYEPIPTAPGEMPMHAPWAYAAARPRAPRGLAIATIVVASTLMVLLIGLAIAAGPAEREYAAAANDGVPASDVLTTFDLLSILLIPIGLAAYVMTCVWLMQARSFAEAYRPGDPHARGKVWIWLGWWVPIVSFFFPYQVVRDIRLSARAGRLDSGPAVILWWWCWLLTFVGMRVMSNLVPSDDVLAPSPAAGLGPAAIFTAVVGALAFVAWLIVVRSIWVSQSEQERDQTA